MSNDEDTNSNGKKDLSVKTTKLRLDEVNENISSPFKFVDFSDSSTENNQRAVDTSIDEQDLGEIEENMFQSDNLKGKKIKKRIKKYEVERKTLKRNFSKVKKKLDLEIGQQKIYIQEIELLRRENEMIRNEKEILFQRLLEGEKNDSGEKNEFSSSNLKNTFQKLMKRNKILEKQIVRYERKIDKIKEEKNYFKEQFELEKGENVSLRSSKNLKKQSVEEYFEVLNENKKLFEENLKLRNLVVEEKMKRKNLSNQREKREKEINLDRRRKSEEPKRGKHFNINKNSKK